MVPYGCSSWPTFYAALNVCTYVHPGYSSLYTYLSPRCARMHVYRKGLRPTTMRDVRFTWQKEMHQISIYIYLYIRENSLTECVLSFSSLFFGSRLMVPLKADAISRAFRHNRRRSVHSLRTFPISHPNRSVIDSRILTILRIESCALPVH